MRILKGVQPFFTSFEFWKNFGFSLSLLDGALLNMTRKTTNADSRWRIKTKNMDLLMPYIVLWICCFMKHQFIAKIWTQFTKPFQLYCQNGSYAICDGSRFVRVNLDCINFSISSNNWIFSLTVTELTDYVNMRKMKKNLNIWNI